MRISGTSLFVYGSLRHDQPEHQRYCRGVTGRQPARIRGRLFRIPEGWRLAVVPSAAMLAHATSDPAADERRRAAISTESIAHAFLAVAGEPWSWIEGELLTFQDAAKAWPPVDSWEGFVPGEAGVYTRSVIPVQVDDGVAANIVSTWAYVAPVIPAGSVEITPEAAQPPSAAAATTTATPR